MKSDLICVFAVYEQQDLLTVCCMRLNRKNMYKIWKKKLLFAKLLHRLPLYDKHFYQHFCVWFKKKKKKLNCKYKVNVTCNSENVTRNCIKENSAGGQLGHTAQSSKCYTAVFPPPALPLTFIASVLYF